MDIRVAVAEDNALLLDGLTRLITPTDENRMLLDVLGADFHPDRHATFDMMPLLFAAAHIPIVHRDTNWGTSVLLTDQLRT